MPVRLNMTNALLDNRIEAIRAAHQEAGLDRAQLDLSGGVDSAVMAGVLALALGPENVILVHSEFSTNPVQTARARELAKGLDCPLIHLELTDLLRDFIDHLDGAVQDAWGEKVFNQSVTRRAKNSTILGSIRSTLRAPVGRACNRLLGGGIRHGTGNECEDRYLRFYQKGGDGEVDSNPLAMLTKGEVYQLAWFLGKRIPAARNAFYSIIEATPSPDLWGNGDGHSDEAELLSWTGAPFTYSRIDVETGQYKSVGTIERVARFLDWYRDEYQMPSLGEISPREALFNDNATLDALDTIVTTAVHSPQMRDVPAATVGALLAAARRIEKITRHKMNPNCPSYGNRETLVRAGILTNDLTIGG